MGKIIDKLFNNFDISLESKEDKRINYYAKCSLEELKAVLPDTISEYHTDLVYQWYLSREKILLMYFPNCGELELIKFLDSEDYSRFIG